MLQVTSLQQLASCVFSHYKYTCLLYYRNLVFVDSYTCGQCRVKSEKLWKLMTLATIFAAQCLTLCPVYATTAQFKHHIQFLIHVLTGCTQLYPALYQCIYHSNNTDWLFTALVCRISRILIAHQVTHRDVQSSLILLIHFVDWWFIIENSVFRFGSMWWTIRRSF